MNVSSDDIRRYYNANTSRFVRFGQGGASLHRAVWGPGVTTRARAIRYVDERIVDEIRALPGTRRVLDLGCGVGATLLEIAARTDVAGVGVTISDVQATRARELIEQAGLRSRLRCRQGTFLALDPDLADFDLAFSIEAFVHSSDAEVYFREAARALRAGGRLVVCDDFLNAEIPRSVDEQRWLNDFREGWGALSLVSVERARRLAGHAGLRLMANHDLTSYLELGRPRDRLIALALSAFGKMPIRSPYWSALRGGDALQRALRCGALAYRILVFEHHVAMRVPQPELT